MKTHHPKNKTCFILNGIDPKILNSSLREMRENFKGREIEITLREGKVKKINIKNSRDVYAALKKIIGKDMDIQEHFIVLYFTSAGKLIGYLDHTRGTTSHVLVDVEIITAVALKTLAGMIVIAHNHPQGDLHVTDEDKAITSNVKKGCSYFGMKLLDHIILTSDGYYSMADHRHPSLDGVTMDKTDDLERKLREEILQQLKNVTEANSPNIWKAIHTPKGKLDINGYSRIETAIIKRIIASGITPSAAIPQLEVEMQE